MATLNTLRTKYGIVLSIVIAVVLLAFILGDQLNNRRPQQQSDDFKVGEIAGKTINASEYYQAKGSIDDRNNRIGADNVADMAWSTLILNNFMEPTCAGAGIVATEAEMERIASRLIQQWAQEFAQYGLSQNDIVAMADQEWELRRNGIKQQMLESKLGGLYALGAYTNKLEVEDNLRNMNTAFSGRYVEVPYSVIADDQIEVSEEELAACYQSKKTKNAGLGNRTISYLLFDLNPTEEDLAAIEAEVNSAAEQLAAAEGEQIKTVARSFAGQVSPFIGYDNIPAEQAEALKSGKMYGPEKLDEVWVMSRVADKVNAPSTFTIECAVFDDKEQADKVVAELKAVDSDFSKLSAAVDTYNQTRDFNMMDEYTAKSFIGGKVGDVISYNEAGKVVVAKITECGTPADFIQVAQIVKEIKPSEATLDAVTRRATSFANKAKASAEAFQNAAGELAMIPRVATVSRGDRDYQTGVRGIRGIDNSRSVAVWAYGAEVGESKSFPLGNSIVVAMVTAIDNNEFAPRNDALCRREVLRDKKFAQIAANLTSFDAAKSKYEAEAKSFAGVKFNDNLLEGGDGEARLIGAIASTTETGVVSQPVKGNDAAYIFVVDAIDAGEQLDAEGIAKERIPLNTQREAMMRQVLGYALSDKAGIVDMRDERVM